MCLLAGAHLQSCEPASFQNPHPCGFMIVRYQEKKNETPFFVFSNRIDSFVGKHGEHDGSSQASSNAHRRLFVRQLSVQHSEGREPSRLRTETERD